MYLSTATSSATKRTSLRRKEGGKRRQLLLTSPLPQPSQASLCKMLYDMLCYDAQREDRINKREKSARRRCTKPRRAIGFFRKEQKQKRFIYHATPYGLTKSFFIRLTGCSSIPGKHILFCSSPPSAPTPPSTLSASPHLVLLIGQFSHRRYRFRGNRDA